MKRVSRKNNSSVGISAIFLVTGVFLLVYSMIAGMQIAAFIGLGLTFWGAVFAVARNRKAVDSRLLDGTAVSSYSTLDRMINDLNYNGQGYYIPAYPQDVPIPEYLTNLKEPVVFISEQFDGKPAVEELASGKFLSEKTHSIFITAPGSGLMAQMERQLHLDFSKTNLEELCYILPRCVTGGLNLAKSVDLKAMDTGANFRAIGILYESLYNSERPLKSVHILGCPLVSAVACALAKTTGKTVIIKEQTVLPHGSGVSVVFGFV